MRLIPTRRVNEKATTPESLETTGFVENWSAALGLTLSEDLPITSRFLPTEVESSRKKLINDYMESGDIPYSVAAFYGDDTDGLAKYAKEKLGLEGFFTNEEYHQRLEEEYQGRREYSESVFSKATGLGTLGRLAGTVHAMALDPLYAVSALTGYGTAATVGRAMLNAAVIEGGISAVAQFPKMSFKEEIGSEYSGAQAVTEVLYTAAGAGAFAGLGKGVQLGLKKLFGPKDLTVREATIVAEKLMKDAPEMEGVVNTLKHADPEESTLKVLTQDEAVDKAWLSENSPGVKEKTEPTYTPEEAAHQEELIFRQRQPVAPEEGVPRGTPTEPAPDTRHPLVAEADNEVTKIEAALKAMEDCF